MQEENAASRKLPHFQWTSTLRQHTRKARGSGEDHTDDSSAPAVLGVRDRSVVFAACCSLLAVFWFAGYVLNVENKMVGTRRLELLTSTVSKTRSAT
jgi:hypothetical protein